MLGYGVLTLGIYRFGEDGVKSEGGVQLSDEEEPIKGSTRGVNIERDNCEVLVTV